MVKKFSLILILFLTFSLSALDTTEFEDPKMQQRYHQLTDELRCLVCQNETIAGSNAPLAKDLRQKVAEQLRAGKSDDEVREYLVERFGEFVSYRPSKKGAARYLWIAPFLFAGLAMIIFVFVVKSNKVAEE